MCELTLAAQRTARGAKVTAFEAVRGTFDADAERVVDRLVSGAITPAEFEAEMRPLIKDVQVGAYVAGRSGLWAEITPRQWGRLGPVVRGQYAFLRRWADEIAQTPTEGLSRAALLARARLYANAARQSLERGMLDEVGVGPDLPAYPGDGTTSCYANCRCRWAVRILSKGRGDYDVSWRLGHAEHCKECRTRSRAWKKLRVRGGVLVDGYQIEGCFRAVG